MARVVFTGATGLLGGHLGPALAARGDEPFGFGGPARGEHGVDVTSLQHTRAALERLRPSAVIHAAALSSMADCAADPARARLVNAEGTKNVALACRDVGARLVHVSTDLVFNGESAPYREGDEARPLSVYGRSKLEAEAEAASAGDAVVARVSLLFGPTRTTRRGFFDAQLEALRSGRRIVLFEDEWRTPLSLRAAAEALAALASSDVRGIVHVGGPERMSRLEMGERLARVLGVAAAEIARASRSTAPGEPRPRDVSLDGARLAGLMPELARSTFEEECAKMLVA